MKRFFESIVKKNEIPLNKIWSDVVTKAKVISAWDAILTDASMEKTAVTDICLENIVMLYVRVRSFSYTKDIATKFKMNEKLKVHKKALRQDVKRKSNVASGLNVDGL